MLSLAPHVSKKRPCVQFNDACPPENSVFLGITGLTTILVWNDPGVNINLFSPNEDVR